MISVFDSRLGRFPIEVAPPLPPSLGSSRHEIREDLLLKSPLNVNNTSSNRKTFDEYNRTTCRHRHRRFQRNRPGRDTGTARARLARRGHLPRTISNSKVLKPTEEDYNLVMNTNVASFFYMTQQVIPQMKKQNSGHVVSISTVIVDQPSGSFPAVLAVLSKSTMPAVSKALALEYAANNIRFNTVSPGNVNTPMHAKDNHAALAKFHPLARMAEISDIVDAVLYL